MNYACVQLSRFCSKDCLASHLQMQTLSIQFVTVPALLSSLGQGNLPSSDKAPLLVSGQDRLCQVFTSWLDSARQAEHGAAGLTAGHGPAMLAFATAAALLKDMPDYSGRPELMCYCRDRPVVKQSFTCQPGDSHAPTEVAYTGHACCTMPCLKGPAKHP